jgi:RNA recognition motif-containing protein
MLTLSVRGLPRTTTEATLQHLFEPHGRVFEMRLAKDLFSGECKGFAELKMEGHSAREAIAALNGTTQGGEMIRVALQSDLGGRRRRR